MLSRIFSFIALAFSDENPVDENEKAGADSFAAGLARQHNPYDENTIAHLSWLKGFNDAEQEWLDIRGF